MNVTMIGTGCGGDGFLPEAERAIAEADLLIGAARVLEAVPAEKAPAAERCALVRTGEILDLLLSKPDKKAAVLFSGDTGFYSGAAQLSERLAEKRIPYRILPGISSVQYFAASLGRSWQDWNLCSAHGASCDLISELKKGRPLFLLTGGSAQVREICGFLKAAGLGACLVTIGEALSYGRQRIRTGAAEELAAEAADEWDPLNVMLIEADESLLPKARTPGIPDADFTRGDVPMTKQEVRAAALAKLAVRPDDVCWDVGAGTGSVSVELALVSKEVWAVERGERACELIEANRKSFRAWNLHVVRGAAPEALEDLPRPDAVFVGGSGGMLAEILRAAIEANPDVRICVSAIALETLHEAAEWMDVNGFETEIAQIAVSRAKGVGGLHLLMANNPVFLISGRRV